MDLTDAQWAVLQPFLHPKPVRKRGRPWQDARAVFNGILWVLRTGAPWHDLPDRYPPYQTCHRRFQQWQRDGTLTRLLHALAEDLRARGKLDLSETFIDASFSSAKKGALLSARLAEVKAVKSWRSQTAMVFLSPATSPALRRMKRNSSKHPRTPFHPCLAGTNDRRYGLRQRPLGPPTVARAPHSHDRAQPPQPPESDPGPSRVAPLLSSLENRTPFRLAA